MLDKSNIKYTVEACGNKIIVQTLWKGSEKVKYACYLKKNEEYLAKTNYQEISTFEFDCENGIYNLVLFVKDITNGEVAFLSTESIDVRVIEISVFSENKVIDCLSDNKSIKIERRAFLDEKELKDFVLIDVFGLITHIGVSNQMTAKRWINRLADCEKEVILLCTEYNDDEEKNRIVFDIVETCRKENIYVINTHQILHRCDEEIIFEDKNAFTSVLKTSLIKLLKRIERRELEKTKVLVKLCNGKLHAIIENKKYMESGEAEYYFYLIKDGEVYQKSTEWSDGNSTEFELHENGLYCVQGYIRIGKEMYYTKSHTKEYFTDEYRNMFNNYIESEEYVEKNVPDFFLCGEPFKDFAIVQTDMERDNELVKGLDSINLYKLQPFGKRNNYLLSSTEPFECEDIKYIISGMIYDEEKILYGNECVEAGNFAETKHLGMYCIADIDKDRIHISTDFFNFNRIFYYDNGMVSICSNRYHLLLIVMKNMGLKCELDEEKALLTLSSANIQFLTQNSLAKMDIRGVYKCPNSYDAVLDMEGFHLVENEYGKTLQAKDWITEKKYRDELQIGCDEVIKNVSNMLHDKRAEHVICDLSGGLDSRAVYGAILKNEFDRDVVGINSYEVKGSNDLDVAIKINNLYGLKWEETEVERKVLNEATSDLWQRSFYMGTYYSHNLIGVSNSAKGTVRLAGACGEILLRPYIVRKYFESNLENIKEEEAFLDYILRDYSAELIVDYEAAKLFVKLLVEEFKNYGVCSNLESIDRIYLEHRHAYHFDQGLNSRLQIMNWLPLQSKALFKLHHNIYDNEKNIKMQLDLLNIIDPYLAAIELEADRDNRDKENLKEVLFYKEKYQKNINLSEINTDRELYDAAMMRRAKKVVRIMSENNQSSAVAYKYKMLCALKFLCKKNLRIKESVGVALYYFITRHTDEDKRALRYLYNKLMSLRDQMMLFE